MSRIIKFKVWDTELKSWIWNLGMKKNNVVVDGTEKGRFKVLQFTGLQDKNDKEIYEGDILRLQYGIRLNDYYIVKYIGGCFICVDNENRLSLLEENVDFCIVIGNIYENPELFGVEP